MHIIFIPNLTNSKEGMVVPGDEPFPTPTRLGRTSIQGKTHIPARGIRDAYSAQFKLAVLDHFAATSMAAIRHRFFPNLDQLQWESTRKMVYKWRAKRATSERLASRTLKCRPRALGHGTVLRRATELELVAWALDLRRDGLPVSAAMLAQKGREFAEEVDQVPVGSFVASRSWQTGFLWRHRLSMRARTRQGQHSNGDGVEAVRAFRQQVQAVIHSKSIKHLHVCPLLDCIKRRCIQFTTLY